MDKARYLVEAHVLEGRSVGELATAHGVHRSWIYKLLARYREGGLEALEPRSRRPRSCPARILPAIVEVRSSDYAASSSAQGHDAGAETIRPTPGTEDEVVPSLSTIWRILKRQGLISPEPQKRPRCSLIRFEAELPNEIWQADITAWQLAGGELVEILNLIDDHSRLFLGSDAYPTSKRTTSLTASTRPRACTGCRPRCCPTTAPSSRLPTPWQGAAPIRAPAARHRVQELTALPPADLREDRAPAPDTEALSGKQPPAETLERCSASSTPSSTTTTTCARTGPLKAARRYRPTAAA